VVYRTEVLGRVAMTDVRVVQPWGPAVLKLVCSTWEIGRELRGVVGLSRGLREVVLAFHFADHCRLFLESCRVLSGDFGGVLLDVLLEEASAGYVRTLFGWVIGGGSRDGFYGNRVGYWSDERFVRYIASTSCCDIFVSRESSSVARWLGEESMQRHFVFGPVSRSGSRQLERGGWSSSTHRTPHEFLIEDYSFGRGTYLSGLNSP
jgi:hypothetical protein